MPDHELLQILLPCLPTAPQQVQQPAADETLVTELRVVVLQGAASPLVLLELVVVVLADDSGGWVDEEGGRVQHDEVAQGGLRVVHHDAQLIEEPQHQQHIPLAHTAAPRHICHRLQSRGVPTAS